MYETNQTEPTKNRAKHDEELTEGGANISSSSTVDSPNTVEHCCWSQTNAQSRTAKETRNGKRNTPPLKQQAETKKHIPVHETAQTFFFFVVRFRFILAMNRREEARKHKSLDTVALITPSQSCEKWTPNISGPITGGAGPILRCGSSSCGLP